MSFEKTNHHYVPQFWQKKFRDDKNTLYGLKGSKIDVVSPKNEMRGDWIYTVFDNHWNPSDEIENGLGKQETKIAALYTKLITGGYQPTPIDRDELCSALALQACRHPDILGRVPKKAIELGELLTQVHDLDFEEFKIKAITIGVDASEIDSIYKEAQAVPKDNLLKEFKILEGLSPQDPQLPVQDALKAKENICRSLLNMDLTLLDAPQGLEYVLGDTPLPQTDLSQGFSVPLSKLVAVKAQPSTSPQNTIIRRQASQQELEEINKAQWENALEIVIASSKVTLEALQNQVKFQKF
ncbi:MULTISPECIES: DUF4238 domain-containing protein [Methylomonas]|uniref:DUF4238 domain-containing protein n=1 Tax=Methylomonas koyamae TaxID=702114 RepID=A0A177NC44_9GAMM|nr:DUF4238 domain-containing protein [Methylomonas koyamae]OAI15204.1 hypothetical protein A1355_10705 [Methylomonas koyamae]